MQKQIFCEIIFTSFIIENVGVCSIGILVIIISFKSLYCDIRVTILQENRKIVIISALRVTQHRRTC